jgi:hypothetical protein
MPSQRSCMDDKPREINSSKPLSLLIYLQLAATGHTTRLGLLFPAVACYTPR